MARPPGGCPEKLLPEWVDDADPKTAIARIKYKWFCKLNHEYYCTTSKRLEGVGCPYCAGHKVLAGFNDIPSNYPHLAEEWNDSRNIFDFVHGSSKKAAWKCKYGHEWEAAISSRRKGRGCPYCAGQRAIPGETDFATLMPHLVDQWDDDKDISTITKNSTYLAKWKCPKGHNWEQKVYVRAKGHGCPVCVNKKILIGYNDLKTTHPHLESEWNDPRPMTDFVAGTEQKVSWKCKNGHEWLASITHRRNGSECPSCTKRISKAEYEIGDFLEQYVDVIRSDRSLGFELDIHIPSKNIAVEYNGLYWHSMKDKNYHYNKWKTCKDAGIQLIMIWEGDNIEVAKNMLLRKIGVQSIPAIGARKVDIVDIDISTARDFMEKYHIQGFATGSMYKAAVYNGDIVSTAIFKKNKDITYLTRYAATRTIQGCLNKMMKDIGPGKYVTFADNCVSDGSLYEKTGWKNDGILKPDYSYFYNGERHHKFNFRLKRFRDDPDLIYIDGMSESKLAALNNIPRLYDCGKIRYTYDIL